MINLSYVLHPALGRGSSLARHLREEIRYLHAMWTLNRLDGATLDDIGVARDQFPALARRHARGLPPVSAASLAD
ncbi:MAG: hypothetical protein U1E52_07140 [Geminicoccaceae bacterium]